MMAVDHGIPRRSAYDDTGRSRDRLAADLRRQRERVAATLEGLCADVRAGRRTMNAATLEAVGQAARRLADLDEALRAIL
jgi:hypothetical protein